jgi:hypothetical protein
MRENPDNAPEKQAAYKIRIEGLTDDQITAELDMKLWLSAFANNNPISCYHWQTDALYSECERRGKPKLYSRAHAKLMRECR